MQHVEPESASSRLFAVMTSLLGGVALCLSVTGCGNKSEVAPPAPSKQGPQTYFSPYVAGTTNGGVLLAGPEIYAIDDSSKTFTQSTFRLVLPAQQGPQVINVGSTTPAQRGLLNLGITTNYALNSGSTSFVATPYDPPKTGGFAVELAGQAGGLLQLVGQPVSPLVAATQCPSSKTAQTYQFVTIPAGLTSSPDPGKQSAAWNPATDTAYGSVDISSDGSSATFINIHQFTLPSVGGTGVPKQTPPAQTPVTGVCGPTVFGSTITLGQLTVKDPSPGNSSAPPQASLGIGPTGLLMEHNGAGDAAVIFPGTSPGLFYDNTLGAGTGAVGLPRPSKPLATNDLKDAQYLGFIYGAGQFSSALASPTGWSSHLASFGFSSSPALPSACSTFAVQTGPLVNGIYGGDFTNDDPSISPDGYGNCDFALDLGSQDDNGLYAHAKVWIGANYAANTTTTTYFFPAVAIAGQLNGKYALFILGVDTSQPWAIYLLQSK